MLGRNSRHILSTSMQAHYVHYCDNRSNFATLQHPCLSSDFVVALLRQLLLLSSRFAFEVFVATKFIIVVTMLKCWMSFELL